MEEQRKIIHIDMDAFYASVEQRDNPALRGIPLAVGGTGKRGVIATASYEARKFGIHSAMSSRTAIRKCPMLQFVAPNFDKYHKVSEQIHKIFHRYTSIIEPLSLDEAYLDVSYSKYEKQSATLIAKQIKQDIKNELNLIASAGVSYNKFLAKIASDYKKPDGLFVILPKEGATFVQELKIEKFYGVGKVMADKLKAHAIFKGKDLLQYPRWELQRLFGKQGDFLFDIARGIDNREVKAEKVRKSVGVENTFGEDLSDFGEINEEFSMIFETWWQRYEAVGMRAKTVTLKGRNNRFETCTRSKTIPTFIVDKYGIRIVLERLLKDVQHEISNFRLIGVSASNFEKDELVEGYRQLTLW